VTKTLNKLGIEEMYSNIINAIHHKLALCSIGNKTGMSSFTSSFHCNSIFPREMRGKRRKGRERKGKLKGKEKAREGREEKGKKEKAKGRGKEKGKEGEWKEKGNRRREGRRMEGRKEKRREENKAIQMGNKLNQFSKYKYIKINSVHIY
jgi:hypothetical protein